MWKKVKVEKVRMVIRDRRVLSEVRSEVFFFSSRRRHTRYWRDWSSDVCSSDLVVCYSLIFAKNIFFW